MQKILLVEDNEADRFLGKVMVENVGKDIEVHIARDGQEALDTLTSDENFDLILLDINMPKMNGHEFLAHYCQNNARDTPVIVMLTSSDQDEDKEQALRYKCVKDYMLKPINEEKILKLFTLINDLKSEIQA